MAMRAIIGALLVANLGAAILAFQPFGGPGPREEQADLSRQLAALDKKLAATRQLVAKVQTARAAGDKFLGDYVTDARVFASTMRDELNRAAKEAGIREMPYQTGTYELIEGSRNLYMVKIQAGYEGSYASLRKLIDQLDKSSKFFIIENLSASSPQQQAGQVVNVQIQLDTFVRDTSGAQGASS